MIVLLLVSLLLVVLSASAVMADQPSGVPHDGACVSYCARAIIHLFVAPDPANPDQGRDDPANWVPLDINQDGKVENCVRESRHVGGQGSMCIHSGTEAGGDPWAPGCPEAIGLRRCALPQDGYATWCRAMHAEENDKHPPPD
jgi:hypothetical protein